MSVELLTEGLILSPSGGGGDVTPPVATVTVPGGSDYDTVKDSPVLVTIIDAASAMAFATIQVQFTGSGAPETIYTGSGTSAGFRGTYTASSISGSGAPGVGWSFSIIRTGSWPRGIAAAFSVQATDAAGNVLQ